MKWEVTEVYTNETNPTSPRQPVVAQFEFDGSDPKQLVAQAHATIHGGTLQEALAELDGEIEDDVYDEFTLECGIEVFYFTNDGRYDLNITPVQPGPQTRYIRVSLTYKIKSDLDPRVLEENWLKWAKESVPGTGLDNGSLEDVDVGFAS